jgi:uncharacterized heparinase superfamily protein
MSTIRIRDLLTSRHSIRRAVKRAWTMATRPRIVSAYSLSEGALLSRFSLEGQRVTKDALLAHFGRRVTPGWPAPPNIIRDLRVDTEELDQKEITALADDILENRFVLGSNAPQITPEGKIAWHLNPTSDPEWLWALNRHQWWPVLGLAYAQTADERYAAAFVAQMTDWVRAHRPLVQKNEKSPSWRLMEVGLRMRISWIPCFALFYASPAFTDEAKMTMLRAIYHHAQFLSRFQTNRNHLLRESSGLVCVGTYLPEFKQASQWRQTALTRLDQALMDQVNRDGSHIEVSTGYQSLVIDEFENIYDLLQANKLSLPREDLASRLRSMYHVMACLVRPDGAFPYVNDGSIYWQPSQLAQAGEKFGRDDWIYVGTGGKRGTCPKDTSVGIADAGLYVMRSHWAENALYLLFDAGPYGGPHGHEDKLSIALSAFGQTFVVDSSHYTYDRADPFRTHFVSSQAHNTVLVDGKSQIRRWQKENLTPRTAAGDYATWISRTDFDYVSASYVDGYSLFSRTQPADAQIIRDVTHTRHILFVKPDYWVIVDELWASAPHRYQVLFHTVPEIVAQAGPDNSVLLSASPEGAALYLVPADSQSVKVSCSVGDESPIQGWYSSRSHHKTPATTVIYEQENKRSTIIATLLYPCAAGQTCDGVSIRPLTVSEGKGLAFTVTTRCGRDHLLFSQGDGWKQFGPYRSRATVAGIRVDGRGHVLSRFES